MEQHKGGCHCGKVRYEVSIDLKEPVISCNCSICSKKGHLLAFVPADRFKLVSGSDSLKEYQFNKHIIHHLFCDTCGIQSFSRGKGRDGAEMVAINARCIDDVDVPSLTVKAFDGKKL